MFLIDDLIIIGIAVASGMAAAKGTTKVREFMNDGETIKCKCSYCGSKGPHLFKKIDRSWTSGGVVGFLTGGAGGIVSGIIAKKLYECNHCGHLIHLDGSKRGWNLDNAFSNAADNFIDYPKLEESYEELASLNERNKKVSQKYQQQIEGFKEEINKKNIDHAELEKRVRKLIAKIKKDNKLDDKFQTTKSKINNKPKTINESEDVHNAKEIKRIRNKKI